MFLNRHGLTAWKAYIHIGVSLGFPCRQRNHTLFLCSLQNISDTMSIEENVNNNNANQKRKYEMITIRNSCEISALHQHGRVKIKDLVKMFPQYSRASIYRHAKRKIGESILVMPTVPSKKRGRPHKLSAAEKEKIVISLHTLRDSDGSFTSPRIGVKAGLATKVSNRTIRRVLNNAGYGYYGTRRK